MIKSRNLSISSQPLANKLRVAFALMSVLPLLASFYLISIYVLPRFGLKPDVLIFILVSIFIAATGFFLVKEIVDRVVLVCTKAKLIASGETNHRLEVGREDEIGDLSDALNQITDRISNNMAELKTYGQRTAEINLEINKRVFILSNLMQVSSLISQGDKLENILKLTIEKCRLLFNSETAFLFIKEEHKDIFTVKALDGANPEGLYYFMNITLDLRDRLFNKLVNSSQPLIVDKENMLSREAESAFYEKFKLKSMLALPVRLRGKIAGILGVGSAANGTLYKKDDIDLLEVLAKQIAIAMENDFLSRRVDKLEIKDALTGLYNEVFIRSRLQEEIKRAIAYQRPCAFVLFSLNSFEEVHKRFGSLYAESALKKAGTLIRDSVSEVDRVARIGSNEFAVVLPEKNKRQAQGIAQDIRKKIELSFAGEDDADKQLKVSVGVSENPLDGVEALELIDKAKQVLNFSER